MCLLSCAVSVIASHFRGAPQSPLGIVFTIITLEHKTGVIIWFFPAPVDSFMH